MLKGFLLLVLGATLARADIALLLEEPGRLLWRNESDWSCGCLSFSRMCGDSGCLEALSPRRNRGCLEPLPSSWWL